MKALTHDFGEKSEIFVFVFNKIGLEIMSHDHLVRKQALLDYKNGFYIVIILGFFSAGLTHDFGQKMKIFSSFVLGQNGPGNSVSRIFEVENKLSYTVKI